jgi:hypothetical protein
MKILALAYSGLWFAILLLTAAGIVHVSPEITYPIATRIFCAVVALFLLACLSKAARKTAHP